MIGIISKNDQIAVVREFFQLFKVPWEFYKKDRLYDVVIITDKCIPVPYAKLVIISTPEYTYIDSINGLLLSRRTGTSMIQYRQTSFPIYLSLATFQRASGGFIRIEGSDQLVGIEYNSADKRTIRLGYDFFDETTFLLAHGQTVDYAHIPTLEIHIALLRNWILSTGLPLVEIPPVPYGKKYIVCLTHDVDFMGIRDHGFDRSVAGFIFRACLPSSLHDLKSRRGWAKLLRNWKAVLSLPMVFLGLCRDTWHDFDRYLEIENGTPSTFFFLPFKDSPGEMACKKGKPPKYRAARYDIKTCTTLINNLLKSGHEIALHGIDAWHDSDKGRSELDVLRQISYQTHIGIRMHWLYYSEDTPRALDRAGFFYDSSLGYNDNVGFRSGTTQVFRLPASNTFELPMNIMDTAMLNRKRMGIGEPEAFDLCTKVISQIRTYGGVLTINWHSRSLSPERNWDSFYIDLLQRLRGENVWFATANQAVRWFTYRRSISFDTIILSRDKVKAFLRSDNSANFPPPFLRVYPPLSRANQAGSDASSVPHSEQAMECIELPLVGEANEVATTF
jgi:hypothetical protein